MSGPYCADCKFWVKMIRSQKGECQDSSKIIFLKSGDRKNEPPETYASDTCENFDTNQSV